MPRKDETIVTKEQQEFMNEIIKNIPITWYCQKCGLLNNSENNICYNCRNEKR